MVHLSEVFQEVNVYFESLIHLAEVHNGCTGQGAPRVSNYWVWEIGGPDQTMIVRPTKAGHFGDSEILYRVKAETEFREQRRNLSAGRVKCVSRCFIESRVDGESEQAVRIG
jgi:hypothetical protein